MKKLICVLLALCLLVCLLAGCGRKAELDSYGKLLGLDLSKAKTEQLTDTHSGFHGDGMTFAVFSFEDDTVKTAIEHSDTWRDLPLSDAAKRLSEGCIYDANGKALIPPVTNGRWFFLDRHSDCTDPTDEKAALGRASFNFTFAVYDSDAKLLYVTEFDT